MKRRHVYALLAALCAPPLLVAAAAPSARPKAAAESGARPGKPLAMPFPADPAGAAAQQTAAGGAAKPSGNAADIAAGRKIFNDNCEHCHGPDAVQGVERRNLRHLYRRYGDKMDKVFIYTVTHGRPIKGMPNWSGILTTAQFRKILAFLHSVQQH